MPTICQKIGNYPAALPRQAGAFLQEDWGALATHLLLDRAACTPAFFRCVLAGGWVVGRSFVEELAASAWPDARAHLPPGCDAMRAELLAPLPAAARAGLLRGRDVAGLSGRRSGRAELRALKEGRPWPNADSGGTGTDSGCVGMRQDASGCVGMRRDFEFQQISANSQFWQNSGKFRQNLAKFQV